MSVNTSDLVPQSEVKQELEEMTIAEIGCEIPKIVISPYICDNTTLSDLFKGSMKINQKIRFKDLLINSSLLYCVLYSIAIKFSATEGKGTPEITILQEYAVKIIQTSHCKNKKGCDIASQGGNTHDLLLSFPLTKIISIASYPEGEHRYPMFRPIIEALISAGANFNTFDPRLLPPMWLAKVPLELSQNFGLSTYVGTPLDHMMFKLHKGKQHNDFYKMSEWDPITQDIPSDFKDPTFRLMLKTIYQHRELSEVVLVPGFTISFKALVECFEKPEKQKTNAFPKPINALIFSYLEPKIEDLASLSCYKRNRTYYQNIFYIGKQFLEEDQAKEAKPETKPLVEQQGQAAQNP